MLVLKCTTEAGEAGLNTGMIDLARQICIKSDLSPLRYPGGKRKLVPLLIDLIGRSDAEVELLIEPFAGGLLFLLRYSKPGLLSVSLLQTLIH
jgi:hypothetical protein